MLRYPATFGHNAFVFNQHLNADGSTDQAFIQDAVVLDARDQPIADFREGREGLHLATGGTLGRSHKGLLYIPLRGRLLVPNLTQQAALADREREMRAAFDPSLCYRDSPSTEGAYSFDFQEPTLDTGTFPTGRLSLRYYARPVGLPRISETLPEGTMRRFALTLVAADPRLYSQSLSTLNLISGGVYTPGDALNRGNMPAPLQIALNVAGGAGPTNFTITRAGVNFVINLQALSADNAVITMETCGPFGRGRRIVVDSVLDGFAYKVSGPETWLDLPVGSTAFTLTNRTNVTSCQLQWHDAWA